MRTPRIKPIIAPKLPNNNELSETSLMAFSVFLRMARNEFANKAEIIRNIIAPIKAFVKTLSSQVNLEKLSASHSSGKNDKPSEMPKMSITTVTTRFCIEPNLLYSLIFLFYRRKNFLERFPNRGHPNDANPFWNHETLQIIFGQIYFGET